jgi:hypothetical protein
MDDLARRIDGYQLALIEVVAYLDREHLIAGLEAVHDGLVDGIGAHERASRLEAIDLLERALTRQTEPASRLHWPG